ncbi:MAG: hypothetical protein SPE88_00270 [Paludibacteraceae bacterium]|nr:hypothetical protein [Paludibacteraceae bacterium]
MSMGIRNYNYEAWNLGAKVQKKKDMCKKIIKNYELRIMRPAGDPRKTRERPAKDPRKKPTPSLPEGRGKVEEGEMGKDGRGGGKGKIC